MQSSFEDSLIEGIEIHKGTETDYCRQALARENPLEPHGNSCLFLLDVTFSPDLRC